MFRGVLRKDMKKNIIIGQYNSKEYPLKRYYYNDIPKHILDVINELVGANDCLVRGGLAYIFITGNTEYLLKDIDLLAAKESTDGIIETLSCADIVYLNKNTFGKDVITAFWRHNDGYFKIDVLIKESLLECGCEEYNVSDVKWKTIPVEYLLENRLEKIAQKIQRGHDDAKTSNHYRVANSLLDYIFDNDIVIDNNRKKRIRDLLNNIRQVLKIILTDEQTTEFIAKICTLVD